MGSSNCRVPSLGGGGIQEEERPRDCKSRGKAWGERPAESSAGLSHATFPFGLIGRDVEGLRVRVEWLEQGGA